MHNYFSADRLTANGLCYVALLENIQNYYRNIIVTAKSYCRMIHHSKFLLQYLIVSQLFEKLSIRILLGVITVNALDFCCFYE